MIRCLFCIEKLYPMAQSSEEIALLIEEVEDDDDDDDDKIIKLEKQVKAERQARREAQLKQNILHYDIPPLPAGKTHHLFISHSNEPEEAIWAENLVSDMERQFGLKCLWPKRDFLAGTHIGEAIHKGILSSLKIVIVLSPASLESYWCKYERDLAFNFAVESPENSLIPLLYSPCEVPDILKTMNYIDVPNGEDYTFRIRRCFDEDTTDLKLLVPELKTTLNRQEPLNGKVVSIQGKKNLKFICRGPAWSFRDLDTHGRYALRKLGSKFAERVFFDTRNLVNSSTSLKYLSITNSCLHCCSVCCAFTWIGILCTLILLGVAELAEQKMIDATVLLFVSVPGFSILVPLLMFAFHKWNIRKLKRKLWNYSLQNVFDTKVLVNIGIEMHVPTIHIMYYDVQPCLDHLVTIVAKKQNNIEEGFNAEIEEIAREKARKIILVVMKTNYQFLFANIQQESVVNRHPTFTRGKCLCEIAEEQLWEIQKRS